MNVFIVEDEYWALLELQTLLKKYESNHYVYYYENGEDALIDLEEKQPDLVITDITMPGMDGLELVEKVKAFDKKIECILLTVHDTFEYAKKGIQLGVTDYILKPIKKLALYETFDAQIQIIGERKLEETEKQHWSINKLLFQSVNKNNYDMERFNNQSYLFIYILIENWKAPISKEYRFDINKVEGLLTNGEKCWFLSVDEHRKILLIANPDQKYLMDYPIKEIYQVLSGVGQVHVCSQLKDVNVPLNKCFYETEQLMDKHNRRNYGFIFTYQEKRTFKICGVM